MQKEVYQRKQAQANPSTKGQLISQTFEMLQQK